jgi:hypothetical protein
MAQGKDLVVKMTMNSNDYQNGLENAKKSMKGFGAKVDQAGSSIVKVMGRAVVAIAAASGAMNTFETAIRSTEQSSDAFDRSIYSMKSAVSDFFQSLSQGNLANFVTDLGEVVKMAKEAYNAIDALGTMNMWSKVRINQLSAQISEQRVVAMSKNSTASEKKEANRLISMYIAQMETLTQSLLGETKSAAKAQLRKMAGVGEEFVSDAELEGYVWAFENQELKGMVDDMYKQYATETHAKGWTMGGGSMAKMPTSYDITNVTWSATDAEHKWRAMNNLLTASEKEQWQIYYDLLDQENTIRQSLAATKLKANRTMERGLTGGSGGTTREATDLIPALSPISAVKDEDEGLAIIEQINRALQLQGIQMQENAILVAVENKLWQQRINKVNQYASAISYAGNAFSSLADIVGDDSPFRSLASAMSGVASQIASFINTYTSLISVQAVSESIKAGNGIPFPFNLVAIAAAGSTLLGIISSLKSSFAGQFAGGGVVGGNSYSGDKLWARVNSGEMILNRQQQSALFGGGGNVNFVIEGSQLRGVLDNYDKTSQL